MMDENYLESSPLHQNDAFDVTLDSFEGPLSLLLLLAQKHKIDITLLSLKPLVEQYIDFVKKHPDLETCADYLRMASYLTWLKSRRLLPVLTKSNKAADVTEEEELIKRLQHLQIIRKAGDELLALPQLGRDYWQTQSSTYLKTPEEQGKKSVSLPDMTALFIAYGAVLSRQVTMPLQLLKSQLFDVEAVFSTLKKKLAKVGQQKWVNMLSLLPEVKELSPHLVVRSSVSATFLTLLLLSHQGEIAIRQSTNFSPIYVVLLKHAKQ